MTILKRPKRSSDPLRSPQSNQITIEDTDQILRVGMLQRAWQKIKMKSETETVFVLAKRNYKVYANAGLTRHAISRLLTVPTPAPDPASFPKSCYRLSLGRISAP